MVLNKLYPGIHIIISKIKEISRRRNVSIHDSQAHYTLFWVSSLCIQGQTQCWLKGKLCCYKDGLWQTPSCGLTDPYFFPWNTRQELQRLSQKHNIYLFLFCLKMQSEVHLFSISNPKQLSTTRFTRAVSFVLKILSCGDLPTLWNS